MKNAWLFPLFLISILINIVTLYSGHNWGDDFSQYIIHAHNILTAKPYGSGIMLEPDVIYPPGFPLLLASTIKFFGTNLQTLKILNIIFWYLTIIFAYRILNKRLSQSLALTICLLLSYLSFFFFLKQNVISDIPFLFFCTAALYYFEEFLESQSTKDQKANKLFFQFILFAGFAYLIRSAGLILFIAGIIYLFLFKKDLKRSFILGGSLIVTFTIALSFTGTNPGFFTSIAGNIPHFIIRVMQNFPKVFQSYLMMFACGLSPATQFVYLILEPVVTYSSYLLFILMCFFVFKRFRSRSLTFIELFSFLYLLALIVWASFSDPVKDFVRYLLPLFIPGILIICQSTEHLNKKFIKIPLLKNYRLIHIFLTLLLFLNICDIVVRYNFTDDKINQKENQEMFSWVKNNLKENDHYMVWSARVVALITGRIGTYPSTGLHKTARNLPERIHDLNIKYLIFQKDADKKLIHDIEESDFGTLTWENSFYKIYTVNQKYLP